MKGAAARRVVTLSALAALGCGSDPPPTSIDLTAIDRSTDPCQDFYQHACGSWLATHPISPDGATRRRFDDAFYAMVPRFRAIVEGDAAGRRADDDPYAQLIGDYDSTCMGAPTNLAARQEVQGMLAPLANATSLSDLAPLLAAQRQVGSSAFFHLGITVDRGVPTANVVTLSQGGIELPSRDDYLDPTRNDLRAAYRQHIFDLESFYGPSVIDPDAAIAVETALAGAAKDPADLRDPRALYNPMTVAELQALSPTFPWAAYLGALGLGEVTRVVVSEPAYFTALDTLLKTTPVPELRAYVAWQLIQDTASAMDQSVLDADFSFWSQQYSGETAPPPREWTCLNATLSGLGMAVSQPYVARYVSPSVRTEAEELLAEIRASMGRHLVDAAWLDDPTRAEAMAKLDAMTELVAYPDAWPTYDKLMIDAGASYLANRFALGRFSFARAVAMLGKPVDRAAWSMTPVTVNASYLLTNAMQFPAGILQLPFFAAGHSPAGNYGGIGTVMGHEMTHGFDDDGRHFDGTGLLRDWWTASVSDAFQARTQCLVDQFSGYQISPAQSLEGALTLGENTADLGGVRVAFDALTAAHPSEPSRGGYDNRQQFFLSFAQLYCSNTRPEALAEEVMLDSHSPGPFRVNGTLVNVPEFAQAFHCAGPAPAVAAPAGRADVCQVW